MSRTTSIKHGTLYAYAKRGCRCDSCTAANTEWHAAYRPRRKARSGRAQAPRRDRPLATQGVDRQCTNCAKIITRTTLAEPMCNGCRRAAKRSVYIHPKVRLAIYERDGWICGVCAGQVEPGLPNSSPWQATLDHITPRSKGGTDEPANLRLTHRYCNAVRSNHDALTLDGLVA